jgi:ferrous iron transport protein A
MTLTPIMTYLRELPVGTRGWIVGYDKAFRGYQGKLLAMGLTPGTTFTVLDRSVLLHCVQIDGQDIPLTLLKQEADALCVEALEDS